MEVHNGLHRGSARRFHFQTRDVRVSTPRSRCKRTLKPQRHSHREETQCKSESNPQHTRACDYLEADPLRVQWALKFIFHIRRTIGSLCHLRMRCWRVRSTCARLLLQPWCSNCFTGQRRVLAAICQSVGHEATLVNGGFTFAFGI